MGQTSVRDLHLKTSELIKKVAKGESFIIELRGKPIAELRPITERRSRKPLPDRESFIRSLPYSDLDSGRILEEDRS